jgi:hypothetical protein
MSAAELLCGLWVVYSQNVMSKWTIRQWWRISTMSGRTNVHIEERSFHSLAQSVHQNNCEKRRFTISEISYQFFTNFMRSSLQGHHRLRYHGFLHKTGSINTRGC